MPRSQGFARGDLDTAFPLDDKFLELRGRLSPDRYYATVGVYFHIVAATWREAERKTGARVVPDAPDIVAELVAVKLLDAEGRVTTRAFTSWIGQARRKRKLATDRQARIRAGKSREVTRDSRSHNSESPPARDRVGTVGNVSSSEERASDRDSLDTYHELTGYRPWGQWSGDELKVASRDYGDATVDAALRAEFSDDGTRDTLWKRVKTRLAKDADRERETKRANGKHRPKLTVMSDEERTAVLAEIPGGLL